ncbi:MAG: hybrid sensor histidine kinase/response regulator, partial [Candidatus Limnocylindrales bacterium]
ALVKAGPVASGARSERPPDEQQRVRITIRDDGPGVPESARARLFDPFFTTKQPGEGTGLGLSVSFGIVAAHDGRLWYEPGPGGVGSSFVIELPVTARNIETGQPSAKAAVVPGPRRASSAHPKRSGSDTAAATASSDSSSATVPETGRKGMSGKKDATPASARATQETVEGLAGPPTTSRPTTPAAGPGGVARPAEPETAAPSQRPRILALDDEPSIRSFLRKALTAAGMECVPFQSGPQALDGVREASFDVMLIDHRMAGMSGTEFYEAATELRPELARRAVFMSGDVLNPDLRGFATERNIRILAKPFDIEAVVRAVREALVAAEQEAGFSGGSI